MGGSHDRRFVCSLTAAQAGQGCGPRRPSSCGLLSSSLDTTRYESSRFSKGVLGCVCGVCVSAHCLYRHRYLNTAHGPHDCGKAKLAVPCRALIGGKGEMKSQTRMHATRRPYTSSLPTTGTASRRLANPVVTRRRRSAGTPSLGGLRRGDWLPGISASLLSVPKAVKWGEGGEMGAQPRDFSRTSYYVWGEGNVGGGGWALIRNDDPSIRPPGCYSSTSLMCDGLRNEPVYVFAALIAEGLVELSSRPRPREFPRDDYTRHCPCPSADGG